MPSRVLISVWLKYRNGRIVCPMALKVKMATLKDKYPMPLLVFTFVPAAPSGISVAVRDIYWM
jgi:hypothetical protein